ncbi:MAG: hypothetical protein M1549_02540 [Candidatus Dependentiae bacterium]|nr:hypothetical protein [Candidatus Dependentiae bacterium]
MKILRLALLLPMLAVTRGVLADCGCGGRIHYTDNIHKCMHWCRPATMLEFDPDTQICRCEYTPAPNITTLFTP